MSFSRMKPIPKFLIIAGVVVAVVAAANFGMSLMPVKAPTVVQEAATTVPAEDSISHEERVQAYQQQASAVVGPAPVTTVTPPAPAPVNDSGLNNLLK